MDAIQVVRVELCPFSSNRRLINMDSTVYDLIINAGRVVCPSTGLDGPSTVAVKGDRIVSVGNRFEGTARQTLDFPNDLLLPGLVDMHAHPLSQGDAGASNWPRYRESVVEKACTCVRLALNLSIRGESTALRIYQT